MSTRTFPLAKMYDLIRQTKRADPGPLEDMDLLFIDADTTGDATGDSDLGVWAYIIFQAPDSEAFYRLWHVRAGAYYIDRCGDDWGEDIPTRSSWEERGQREGDVVHVEVVQKKERVVYEWEV